MRRIPPLILHLVVLLALGLAGCGQPQPAVSPTPTHPPPTSSPAAVDNPTAVPVAAPPATPTIGRPTPTSVAFATPASPAVAVATPAGSPSPLTVAEVYRRVAQALARPGLLFHATMHYELDYGAAVPPAKGVAPPTRAIVEHWVDVGRDVARLEARADPPGPVPAQVTISTAQGQFTRSSDGQVWPASPQTCDGAGVAVTAFYGCPTRPDPVAQSTTAVEEGQYGGRPTVILVTTGANAGDGTGPFTNRLYLDAGTYLPLAGEGETQHPAGARRYHATYAHEFLPITAVPADFFDPASLGYAGPTAPLDQPGDQGLAVYWLGERYAGADGLPPLALGSVETGHPQGPGYRFTLFYGPAADPFGMPLVRLQEWPRAAWDALPPEARPDPPCWAREELALPGGRATILMGVAPEEAPGMPPRPPDPGACPAGPYNTFLAHAYLGETVVLVILDNGPGNGPNPYNTRAGVEAILRALQPRAAATAPTLPGLPQTGGGHGRVIGDGGAR